MIEQIINFEELWSSLLDENLIPEIEGNKEMFHLDIIGEEIEIENWNESIGKHWTKIKKIFRHKVNKPKWEVISESNQKIEITGDHSICIFRDNKKIEIKAPNINIDSDLLMVGSKLEKIKEVNLSGYFNNEWVYDIEVEDYSHTFFANNILVHNSNYFSFDELLKSCNMHKKSEEEIREFLLKLDSQFLSPFYEKAFDDFTKKRNLENNLKFETEAIARRMVILAKNINFQNISWNEGTIIDPDKVELKYTGGKIKSSTTPLFARKMLKDLFMLISDHKIDITIDIIVKKLKEIKKEVMIVDINEIAETGRMSDYNHYVIEDKSQLLLRKGTPYRVSAAAKYNHALNKQKESIRKRYKPILDGKIKIYPIGNKEYFAYNIGEYPLEFAPPADRRGLFDKFILKTVNDIFERAMKTSPLSKSLVYMKPLF